MVGFADLSEIDPEMRYGYQYGICIAIDLRVFPSPTSEPSKEYYDKYKDVSARLREASEKIKELGYVEIFNIAATESFHHYGIGGKMKGTTLLKSVKEVGAGDCQ